MLSRLVDVLDEKSAGGRAWLGTLDDNVRQEFLRFRSGLTSQGVGGDALINKLDAWIRQKGFKDTLQFLYDIDHP